MTPKYLAPDYKWKPKWNPTQLLVIHKYDHSSYQYFDSITGIHRTYNLGKEAVAKYGITMGMDTDLQVSKDKAFVATHWNDVLAHYFTGPFQKTFRISNSTMAQIGKLTSTHRDSKGVRIVSARRMMQEAAKYNVALCFEAKAHPGFEKVENWKRIRFFAEKYGCKVAVMTIQDYPNHAAAVRKMKAAHDAGLPTILLLRKSKGVKDYEPYVDFGKGGKHYITGTKIKHMGNTVGDASMYGSGCNPGDVNAIARAVHAKYVASKK